MDTDKNRYIYLQHEGGGVSRVLKPAHYRERLETKDTVQPGQAYAAVLFEPSIRAAPDPDAIYGLLQVVGCFPNEEECVGFIRRRILSEDRADEYLVMPCGSFVPLSTAPAALSGIELVDLEKKLHGDYKEIQERRDAREQEEIAHRQEVLKRESEKARQQAQETNTLIMAEKEDSLKAYVRLRVARASARAAAHRMDKQTVRIAEMRRKMLDKADHFEAIIRARDAEHDSQYAREYLPLYTKTLIEACTTVTDADDDADYFHLNLAEEPPILLEAEVNPQVKERYKRQSHEEDDQPPAVPVV